MLIDWLVIIDIILLLVVLTLLRQLRKAMRKISQSVLVESQGELPYKKDGDPCEKFWKRPLRGTKILFCGRGFSEIFFTPKWYQI